MKRSLTIFFVTLLAVCGFALTGCEDKEALFEIPAEPPVKASAPEPAPEPESVPVDRSDADGLVTVRTQGDEVSIRFQLDKWEEDYAVSTVFTPDELETLRSESFPVTGLSGVVSDVCIGLIDGFDQSYTYFVSPVAIFLMEDGSVEHITADPFLTKTQGEFVSCGKILGLTKVKSLSYEAEDETKPEDESGPHTIYAADEDGLRYDVRAAYKLTQLVHDRWITVLEEDEYTDSAVFCGYLAFSPDGTVTWNLGRPNSEIDEMYAGTYEIIFAEQQEYPVGSILLDLDLSQHFYEGKEIDAPEPTHSVYGTDPLRFSAYEMNLSRIDGDLLPSMNAKYSSKTYKFVADVSGGPMDVEYISFQTDEDYINFLKGKVPEVQRGMGSGQRAILTGQSYELGGQVCYEIALGTDREGTFVREKYYAVGDGGPIYLLNPETEEWEDVFAAEE